MVKAKWKPNRFNPKLYSFYQHHSGQVSEEEEVESNMSKKM